MNENLRVLFVSDRSLENPYQDLLEAALGELGIGTHLHSSGGHFPFLGGDLWRFRPQVLHFQWISNFLLAGNVVKSILKSFIFMTQVLLARLAGLRIVWTVHNLGHHERRMARTERLLSICLARLCHALLVHHPEADGIVRDAYRLPSGKQILVVEHPSYLSHYPHVVSRDEARRALGLGDDEVVFLCFGLMRRYKRVTELIRAFKHLRRAEARLILAGRVPDDDLRGELAAELSNDGRIMAHFEFIPTDQVQVYMVAADAVIMPAEEVLTSGSAVLAMSFGRAILAADAPHLRHLIGTRGGLLFAQLTEEEICRAMERAYHADLMEMGRHNRERISGMTWHDAAIRLNRLYEDLRTPGLSRGRRQGYGVPP